MDRVLGWLFRQVEAAPHYTPERCLATKATGCTLCAEACPHEAITIGRRVEIDPIDCTGCGICVAVCPTGALDPRGRTPVAAAVRCSQVPGDAPSVTCLARITATDMLRCAEDGSVLLAHGSCGDCSVGDGTVPERVRQTAERAATLASVAGAPLEVRVEERERLDPTRSTGALTRRDLLRGGGREARRAVAGALAPLERLAPEDEPDAERVPLPIVWRETLRTFELAGLAPEDEVPVRLPTLTPGCILCPSCTRVCPTDALRRTFDETGAATLHLEPDRCIGCDACMEICPVDVVRMVDGAPYAKLTGGSVLLAASEPATGPGRVTR